MTDKIALTGQVALSPVVAGCMRLVEAGLTAGEIDGFARACMDMGVTTFDHAPVYGGFTVEQAFGNAVLHKAPGLRAQMQIVTKTGIALDPGGRPPIYYDASAQAIRQEVDRSLQRLGTDYLDVLLVHRPDLLASPQETGGELDRLVKAGKVRAVGVSNYTPAQVGALQKHMRTPLAVHQVRCSVAATEIWENGVLDDAQERGMALMAWSPFARGAVFQGQDPAALRLKAELANVAHAHGTTPEVIMYAWLLAHPARIAPITGTVKPERVRTAVQALDIKLTRPQWYGILAASRGYDVP